MKENTVLKMYLIAKRSHLKKIPVLPKIIQLLIRLIFSSDIPYTANIHKDAKFGHNALGVVIHQKAKIGAGSLIMQHVTIGGNLGKSREYNGNKLTCPIIGDNVFIGPNASILGPVVIGNNVQIGAGAVVMEDIPANAIAVGSPARVVKILKNEEIIKKW